MTRRILLTGGGTAGHVTPNLAIVPRLRELSYEIHYAGTARGIEFELMKPEHVIFHGIAAGKLRRYFDFKNFTDIFRIVVGFLQSLGVVARVRPAVVFSKGGFVSCPIVWASWLFRIPVVIHESDITPGLANRLSIPFATAVCYSFPETAAHVPAAKSFRTGLPVREQLLAGSADKGRARCGFTDTKPVLMVVGGSQGAASVNALVRETLPELLKAFNICHICGKGGQSDVTFPGYCQFEYVKDELADLFALADLVVSRSGATTLFELVALRKPNLLIPLSTSASRGDQILNARSFERQGFSRVLLQQQATSEKFLEQVKEAFEARRQMISAMERSGVRNGISPVIEVIGKVAKLCVASL